MNDFLQESLVQETGIVPDVEVKSINKYRFLRKSGDILQILIPLTAFVLTCFRLDVSTIALLYALAVCVLITHSLKYFLNFRRPNGGRHSFPSGHASFCFTGAVFIHLNFGISLAILPYICAVFVAITRVIARKHYSRDVFAGAVIGSGSALAFSY